MSLYLRARLSLWTFSSRRSRIFSPVAFPSPRPQSTHAASTPGSDAGQVVPLFVYQQLVSEKKELVSEKKELVSEKKELVSEKNELYKKIEQASKEVKELYEKMVKKQEDMSKKHEEMSKEMFKKHEKMSNKCETYASKVADLKVSPSSACPFSTSLTLTRYFKGREMALVDEKLRILGNFNVRGALGIVPPSLSFATTNMHRTHRLPGLSRWLDFGQRRDATETHQIVP